MTNEELRKILEAAPAGRNAKLSHVNLAGSKLNDANLSYADLHGANLGHADLADAKLHGANLSYANLAVAKLSHADLHSANLSYADLHSANLSHADLAGAKLGGANLSFADLGGANLIYANLTGANLIYANLTGAKLGGATIPTGETWESYLNDAVPALLVAGGRNLRDVATAEHWSCHSWKNSPMAAAFGASDIFGIPTPYVPRVKQFIQFFDAGLIPRPRVNDG